MTNNLTPYVVLAALVAASLIWKGYLKLPIQVPSAHPPEERCRSSSPKLGSDVLGLAFAKAKRREAEDGLAEQIARQAGASIHATFTAPFSPAPAGQDPNPAGDHTVKNCGPSILHFEPCEDESCQLRRQAQCPPRSPACSSSGRPSTT